MAKGNGGTRASKPAQASRGTSIVTNISDFSPEKIVGPKLSISQQTEVRKIEATWTGKKDIYDLNIDRIKSLDFPAGKYAKDRDIDVNKVYTMQNYLNKETVAKYIDSPSAQDKDGDYIVAIRVPNTERHIIINGNHRIAAAKLSGKNTIRAKVLEVPESKLKSLQKRK